MNKDVLAVRAGDEAKTLGVVEPLHCSLFHGTAPYICYCTSATGGHGDVQPGVP
jgi:hypothetical protein